MQFVDDRVIEEAFDCQGSSNIDDIGNDIATESFSNSKVVLFTETDEIGFFQKRDFKARCEPKLNVSTTSVITDMIGTGAGPRPKRAQFLPQQGGTRKGR